MTLWVRGLAKSSDKKTQLYIHYQSVNGYQTWQDGNLSWWLALIKSHLPLIMWSCEIIISLYLHYHNICGHKSRQDGDLPWLSFTSKKSNDPIITWFCEITWQTKTINYPLTQCLWLSVLAQWGCPTRSVLSSSHHNVNLLSRDHARSCKLF